MQAKIGEALASQQKGMTQLHQAMAKLSSTQESVASSVVMVKEEVREELRNGWKQSVMRPTARRDTSRAKGGLKQEQLEAAIHSLTADNDRLSKEVAGLEENNQSLKAKLHDSGGECPESCRSKPGASLENGRQHAGQPAAVPFLGDVQ